MKGVCFVCGEEKEIVNKRMFKGENTPKPVCEDCDGECEESLFV